MTKRSRAWDSTLGSVTSQGKRPKFESPRSPSGKYLAYVMKVEEIDDQGNLFVFLDMMSYEWATNASSTIQPDVPTLPPAAPTTTFTLPSVSGTALATLLNVSSTSYVAEGCWYYVELAPPGATAGKDQFTGDLTDSNYPDSGQAYGDYTLTRGQLLLIPQQQSDFTVRVVAPPANAIINNLLNVAATILALLQMIGAWFLPVAAPAAPPPPPAVPAPSVVSIGVMDVGAAGCNLLFKITPNSNPQTLEPIAYVDVGIPINAWVASAPNTIRPGGVGPIVQNASDDLEIVLTHWDWDHWMLSQKYPDLQLLQWTVPQQPTGPTAVQLLQRAPFAVAYPAGTPSLVGPNGDYTIYQVVLPAAAAGNPAFIMNNSGLAVLIPFVFPVAGNVAHKCLLPGDASLGNIHPLMPQNDISVYGGSHHGAATFGSELNIPAPVVVPGAVVFSYGITHGGANPNNTHSYGHPNQLALTNNTNAGFTRQYATAETNVVNGAAPEFNGVQGNVLIGQNLPLDARYAGLAFFNFVRNVA